MRVIDPKVGERKRQERASHVRSLASCKITSLDRLDRSCLRSFPVVPWMGGLFNRRLNGGALPPLYGFPFSSLQPFSDRMLHMPCLPGPRRTRNLLNCPLDMRPGHEYFMNIQSLWHLGYVSLPLQSYRHVQTSKHSSLNLLPPPSRTMYFVLFRSTVAYDVMTALRFCTRGYFGLIR